MTSEQEQQAERLLQVAARRHEAETGHEIIEMSSPYAWVCNGAKDSMTDCPVNSELVDVDED